MKKVVKKILCAVLTLSMLTSMTFLASAEEEITGNTEESILFQDDFETEGLNSEWTVGSGEYEIKEGTDGNHILNLRGIPWGSGLTMGENKTEWKNYSVEMEFKINSRVSTDEGMRQYDNIGLAGKISNNNRIALYYRIESKKLELNKFYANAGHNVAEVDYPLTDGAAYNMKLEFSGETVSGYIAEKGQDYPSSPQIQFSDDGSNGPKFENGGCGIENGGYDVDIDNFVVKGHEDITPIESITIKKSDVTLEKGEKVLLPYEITPDNASTKDVTWSSSDEGIATVDNTGEVTGISKGTATITAGSASNPGIHAECTINVYETAPCEKFYYVSPAGSDSNDGSEASPFATIQKARDTIRALKDSEGAIPEGGITVYLREGEYSQGEALEFTAEDSGEIGKPIIYTSYPGEKAVITGGQEITGWRKAEEVPYMSDKAKGNLYVADIEPGWRFHDLYVDGERQQISRQMETDQFRTWPQFSGAIGEPDTKFLKVDAKKGIKVRFNEGELAGLANNPDIEIDCMTVMFWNALPILKDVNEEENTAWLYSYNPTNLSGGDAYANGTEHTSFNTKEGGWYSILNDIKYLDTPGEWVVDSVNGKVYYWPKDDHFSEKRIIAPKPAELIRFQGDGEEELWKEQVHHVVLDNLSMVYADRVSEDQFDQFDIIRNSENPDGMIVFDGTEECRITNCEIKHCGSYGVTVRHYAQKNEISGNQIVDMGSGGINLSGYGPGIVDLNKENKVTYNTIKDLGKAPYYHTAGISVYQSGENAISYNYISESPYAGVSIVGEVAVGFNTDKYSASWDFFGNEDRQYGFRWKELKEHKDYSREEVKQFVHSRNNVVEYNIIDEYMTGVEDGGGLYAWGCGNGNKYCNNIIIKTEKGMHWTFPLYMDDGVDEITVSGNRVWSMEQGIIDKGSNHWSDNLFAWPGKPGGYDDLKNHILTTIEQETGRAFAADLNAAELQYPGDGETDISQPFEMSWDSAGDGVRYRVEVAADEAFQNVVSTQMTSKTSIQGPDLEWGQTYYWRVGSCAMAEPVVYSQVKNFTMAGGDSVITVDAVGYTNEQGTKIQVADDGSDEWLAYIDDGDWMEYKINVKEPGKYQLNYKASVDGEYGKVEFIAGDNILASTVLPSTGGWQNWTRVSDEVEFSEPGEYVVRLNVVIGKWNLDKFELIKMKPNVDKTLLQELYDYALTLSTEGVTENAKEFFGQVLAEAKAVLDNPDATQEEVDTAWNHLEEGIKNLGNICGDITGLELMINKADGMIAEKDRYVEGNWQQLIEALDKAKEVLDNKENATQDVIDEATDNLFNAIQMQRYKANKENLKKLIEQAEGIDVSKYTKETVKVFQEALANAKAILEDGSLSADDQQKVDQAVKELDTAIQQLKPVANGGNDGDNSGNGSGSGSGNGSGSSSGNGSGSSSGNGSGNDSGDGNKNAPKTGDENQVIWYMMLAIIAGACAFAAVKRKTI